MPDRDTPEKPKKEESSSASLATLLGITGAVTGTGAVAGYKANKLAKEGEQFLNRGKYSPDKVIKREVMKAPPHGFILPSETTKTKINVKGKTPGTSFPTENPLRLEAQNRLAAQTQVNRLADRATKLPENTSRSRLEKAGTQYLNSDRALEIAEKKPGMFQKVTRNTPLKGFAENLRAGEVSRALDLYHINLRKVNPRKDQVEPEPTMNRGRAAKGLIKSAALLGGVSAAVPLARQLLSGNTAPKEEQTSKKTGVPPFEQMKREFIKTYGSKPTQQQFSQFSANLDKVHGAYYPEDINKFKAWGKGTYQFR